MHGLALGSGEPTPNGLWVNCSSMSTQRHGRKSVPTGTRGGHQSSKCPPAWPLLPSMQLLELLWGCGEGPVLRPCSTDQSGESESLHAAEGPRHTARAPGRKRRRSWGPGTCNTSSTQSGGGREKALLVSPQQSRNKQTMAPAPLASSSGARGLSGAGGLECWSQAQVWLCWVRGMVFHRRWGQLTGVHLQLASGGWQAGCLLG